MAASCCAAARSVTLAAAAWQGCCMRLTGRGPPLQMAHAAWRDAMACTLQSGAPSSPVQPMACRAPRRPPSSPHEQQKRLAGLEPAFIGEEWRFPLVSIDLRRADMFPSTPQPRRCHSELVLLHDQQCMPATWTGLCLLFTVCPWHQQGRDEHRTAACGAWGQQAAGQGAGQKVEADGQP